MYLNFISESIKMKINKDNDIFCIVIVQYR